jgi:hypothetical protein
MGWLLWEWWERVTVALCGSLLAGWGRVSAAADKLGADKKRLIGIACGSVHAER